MNPPIHEQVKTNLGEATKQPGNSSANRANVHNATAHQMKLRQTLTSNLGKTQTKLISTKPGEKAKVKSRAPSNSKNMYQTITNADLMQQSKTNQHASRILEAQQNLNRANLQQSKNLAMKKQSLRSTNMPNLQMNKVPNAVEKKLSQ